MDQKHKMKKGDRSSERARDGPPNIRIVVIVVIVVHVQAISIEVAKTDAAANSAHPVCSAPLRPSPPIESSNSTPQSAEFYSSALARERATGAKQEVLSPTWATTPDKPVGTSALDSATTAGTSSCCRSPTSRTHFVMDTRGRPFTTK